MKTRAFGMKSFLFLLLASVSFSASAMYVGNPHRPNTIWVPGHCVHGCWVEGYYLKFMRPVHRCELVWVKAHHGVPGHWVPVRYVVVNSYY